MKIIRLHSNYFQARKIKTTNSPLEEPSYKGVVEVVATSSETAVVVALGERILVNEHAGKDLEDGTLLLMTDHILAWIENDSNT